MVDPRGNSPKEIDLETLFAESFSALPPDEVVEKVNPFRRAVNRVLIGMALCTLTLNFWGLNYIPAHRGHGAEPAGLPGPAAGKRLFHRLLRADAPALRPVLPHHRSERLPLRDDFIPSASPPLWLRSSLRRSCWAYSACGWGCGRCSGRRTCRPRRAGSWRCWCGTRSCMYWR